MSTGKGGEITKSDDNIRGGNTPCVNIGQAENKSRQSEATEAEWGRVAELTEHAMVCLGNKVLAPSGEEGALISLGLGGLAGPCFEVCSSWAVGCSCHRRIKYLKEKEE